MKVAHLFLIAGIKTRFFSPLLASDTMEQILSVLSGECVWFSSQTEKLHTIPTQSKPNQTEMQPLKR